jgi:hypothetical protein
MLKRLKLNFEEALQGNDRLEVCYNSPKIIEIVTIKGRATELSRVTPLTAPAINATRDALGNVDGGIYPEAGRGDFRGY